MSSTNMAGLAKEAWKIGRVSVAPIVETVAPVSPDRLVGYDSQEFQRIPDWLRPYFTPDQMMPVTVQAFVIDSPDARIIVDTCLGNDRVFKINAPTLHTAFLEDLTRAGVPRESFDVVVCTHLHIDHVGWNTMLADGVWVPTFPNATYLFARTEYQHWTRNDSDVVELEDTINPVIERGLHQLVDSDHEIADGISLVATPGHVSVRIVSGAAEALISGDMLLHPLQLKWAEWSSHSDSDRAQATKTRREVLERAADRGSALIGSHFSSPALGRVSAEGDGWRFSGVPEGGTI